LAGYFLAKGVTPEAVTVMLTDWAKRCRPPLPANEVHCCVESIADREGRHDDDPKTLTESLVSVADLYATSPDQHEWILEDYIPRGSLVMLASEEKVGKSTWTYAMVAAIVQDRTFMNRKTERVPVLMLAVEEHQTDVKIRSIKLGIKPDDPVRFYFGDLESDDATYRSLRDAVKTTGAGLVVLDTLGHHLANVLESENDNQQMIKAVKPWLRLARDTNAAVLIIHHAGKTGAAYRGASGLGGIVDQILTLRHGGDTVRGIESRGRYEQTPKYLRIKLEGTQYRVL
jgi:RecA-family ATPase